MQRKNAFTHRISIVFAVMALLTTAYINFGLFHMGNPSINWDTKNIGNVTANNKLRVYTGE